MNISVIGGTGYVGLTAAACLAYRGHKVYCVDKDERKIELTNQGTAAFYEEQLGEILKQTAREKRLIATLDYDRSISDSSIIFICAGTPSTRDGGIDLRQILNVAESVGGSLQKKDEYCTVAVKSTVVPGTTESIIIPILEGISGKKAGTDFGVCMNPEFLREGSAVKDFLFPREQGIVIGELDKRSGDGLFELYEDFDAEILRTTIRAAEMIKYARNSYLAKDISFANEIANVCQRLGIDFLSVKKGIEMDSRIGKGRFLNAGIGFGGSCFTKDVSALVARARQVGIEPKILEATLEVNKNQPNVLLDLIMRTFGGLKGMNVAVLGLAFKPGTDDMREARSIPLVERLLDHGALVCVYDPKAVKKVKEIFGKRVSYAQTAQRALVHADLCVVATEWEEFSDPKLYDCMRGNFIFDGRRSIDPKKLAARFVYRSIGFPEGDRC